MEKFYLSVPFEEKDIAKSKGARWEPEKRKWYVPEGLDSLHFIKWIPELTPENEHNLYSENYFIGESSRRCWKCDEQIPLYAFYLPEGTNISISLRWIMSGKMKSRGYGMRHMKEWSCMTTFQKLCGVGPFSLAWYPPRTW